MSEYEITGMATTIDWNFAFIYDSQNPRFTVRYKNYENKIKRRTYQAQIKSIGLKIELAFKLNFIFFTNTDFNFYNTNKEIEIGYGIESTTEILDFTYAKFINAPGGIIIIGIPIPWSLMVINQIIQDQNSIGNKIKNMFSMSKLTTETTNIDGLGTFTTLKLETIPQKTLSKKLLAFLYNLHLV